MIKHSLSRSVLGVFCALAAPMALAAEVRHPRVALLTSADDVVEPEPNDPVTGHWTGYSVALRNSTAVVGMPLIDHGRAAIFQRTSSGWHRTGTLRPTEATPDHAFGGLLVIRDNTIVVGSDSSVYVFKLIHGQWRQTQKLTRPAAHVGLHFPTSLAYQDGLLVVGARSNGEVPGAVYLFELSNAGKLVRSTRMLSPEDDLINNFGAAVAMSSTHVLVGASRTGRDDEGAAYLYRKTATGWRLQQQLRPTDPQFLGYFGESVAINNGIIAIGAPGARTEPYVPPYRKEGAVYVFTPISGMFTPQQIISPPLRECDVCIEFGAHVAMSDDRLAITGRRDTPAFFYRGEGAAFTYRLNNGQASWIGVARGFIAATSMAFADNWLLLGSPYDGTLDPYHSLGYASVFDINRASR